MTTQEPMLYDTKAAAAVLSVSPGFLEQLRVIGGGPDFIKVKGRGRHGFVVRYTPDSLRAWVASQQSFQNTTQADLAQGA